MTVDHLKMLHTAGGKGTSLVRWGKTEQPPMARIGAVAVLFLLCALGVGRERCVVCGVACQCIFTCA